MLTINSLNGDITFFHFILHFSMFNIVFICLGMYHQFNLVLFLGSSKPMTDKKGQHNELPGVIRIGLKTVDSHCQESTLVGETGSHMDRFRRNALREYFQAVKICQEKGVILTPELLDHG